MAEPWIQCFRLHHRHTKPRRSGWSLVRNPESLHSVGRNADLSISQPIEPCWHPLKFSEEAKEGSCSSCRMSFSLQATTFGPISGSFKLHSGQIQTVRLRFAKTCTTALASAYKTGHRKARQQCSFGNVHLKWYRNRQTLKHTISENGCKTFADARLICCVDLITLHGAHLSEPVACFLSPCTSLVL